MLYFDNVFNSPTFFEKLFDREIYFPGTVRSDQKNTTIMKKDKDMKRSGIGFQFSNNVVAAKWFDNPRVAMVNTCLEECNKVSTVTRRKKGHSAKIPVSCPEIINDYNSGEGGVDILDEKQLLTNSTAVYMVGVITLDYFLI